MLTRIRSAQASKDLNPRSDRRPRPRPSYGLIGRVHRLAGVAQGVAKCAWQRRAEASRSGTTCVTSATSASFPGAIKWTLPVGSPNRRQIRAPLKMTWSCDKFWRTQVPAAGQRRRWPSTSDLTHRKAEPVVGTLVMSASTPWFDQQAGWGVLSGWPDGSGPPVGRVGSSRSVSEIPERSHRRSSVVSPQTPRWWPIG